MAEEAMPIRRNIPGWHLSVVDRTELLVTLNCDNQIKVGCSVKRSMVKITPVKIAPEKITQKKRKKSPGKNHPGKIHPDWGMDLRFRTLLHLLAFMSIIFKCLCL